MGPARAPRLFVTTLLYVATRLLGVERDDPLVAPARRFLLSNDVFGTPSYEWFWLALLNRHERRGDRVVLAEPWSMPRSVELHPSNWFCHTRHICMAMAAVYPHRFQLPVTLRIEGTTVPPKDFMSLTFPSLAAACTTPTTTHHQVCGGASDNGVPTGSGVSIE